MTGILLIVSILTGSVTLWWGFSSAGLTFLVNWLPIFALAWIIASRNGQGWYSWLGLVLYLVLSATGLWIRLLPGWMFAAGTFAFAAWDLTHFHQRIKFIIIKHERTHSERIHISRLSLLVLVGLSSAEISMMLRGVNPAEWNYFVAGVILTGLLLIAYLYRIDRPL